MSPGSAENGFIPLNSVRTYETSEAPEACGFQVQPQRPEPPKELAAIEHAPARAGSPQARITRATPKKTLLRVQHTYPLSSTKIPLRGILASDNRITCTLIAQRRTTSERRQIPVASRTWAPATQAPGTLRVPSSLRSQ